MCKTKDSQTASLTMTPTECSRLYGATPKYWRDQCRAGSIKAVQIGKLWFINREALAHQMGLSGYATAN